MATTEKPPRTVWTVAECAAEIGVSIDTITAHIKAGNLRALDVTPPNPKRTSGGRRTYRIPIAEWERFKAASTTQGSNIAEAEEETPVVIRRGRPKAGTPKPKSILGNWRDREG